MKAWITRQLSPRNRSNPDIAYVRNGSRAEVRSGWQALAPRFQIAMRIFYLDAMQAS
jgi:hypothetical protein